MQGIDCVSTVEREKRERERERIEWKCPLLFLLSQEMNGKYLLFAFCVLLFAFGFWLLAFGFLLFAFLSLFFARSLLFALCSLLFALCFFAFCSLLFATGLAFTLIGEAPYDGRDTNQLQKKNLS